MNDLTISVLPGEYALCRLNADEAIPAWMFSSAFYTVSKSADELSVVAEAILVPENVKHEKGWQLLKIEAVLDLSLTGITARFSTALAEAGVNLCVIATFDTDYIMVKEQKLQVALNALTKAGFSIQQ